MQYFTFVIIKNSSDIKKLCFHQKDTIKFVGCLMIIEMNN